MCSKEIYIEPAKHQYKTAKHKGHPGVARRLESGMVFPANFFKRDILIPFIMCDLMFSTSLRNHRVFGSILIHVGDHNAGPEIVNILFVPYYHEGHPGLTGDLLVANLECPAVRLERIDIRASVARLVGYCPCMTKALITQNLTHLTMLRFSSRISISLAYSFGWPDGYMLTRKSVHFTVKPSTTTD